MARSHRPTTHDRPSTRLTRADLAAILDGERLERASFEDWLAWFRAEETMARYLPDGVCVSDPRNADRIVFNAARASRPHDNRPSEGPSPPCIVCTGQLTRVLDVADLSDGFTFINKNLYPVVFPFPTESAPKDPSAQSWPPSGVASYGLHLLQWTSSRHDLDWHNMPAADRKVVTKRLAALERKLLIDSRGYFPPASTWGGPEHCHGFVQIIKNYGAPVGGSVAHGHQQIALVNVMPRRARDDWRFEQTHGETFSQHILRENPSDLDLFDYGPARLLVPYFMRRPYDMMLVFKNPHPRYLHEMDEESLAAFSDAWRDGVRLMHDVLTGLGRNVAYNIVVHTGPGAGVYVEFLPYTQEVGGLEQSGLWICQASPKAVAGELRALLEDSPTA